MYLIDWGDDLWVAILIYVFQACLAMFSQREIF